MPAKTTRSRRICQDRSTTSLAYNQSIALAGFKPATIAQRKLLITLDGLIPDQRRVIQKLGQVIWKVGVRIFDKRAAHCESSRVRWRPSNQYISQSPLCIKTFFSLSTGFLTAANISTRANDTGLKEAGKGGNHATDRPSRGDKHS